MLSEVSTTKSNCMLFNMNNFKKISRISIHDNPSLVELSLTSCVNEYLPSLELLLSRLMSLSDCEAKSLTITVIMFKSLFEEFMKVLMPKMIGDMTLLKSPNQDLEDMKMRVENDFIKTLNLTKPYVMINTHFNLHKKSFEIYNIKVSLDLLGILGYKLEEFLQQCMLMGLPSIFVFRNYFSAVNQILQSRINRTQTTFQVALITADEDQLHAEAKTYSCHMMNDNLFCCSIVFEFEIYPWSLEQHVKSKNNRKKKGISQELLAEKKENIEVFMKKFYEEEFEKKFHNKVIFQRSGYQNI